jgi:hypothetical protein
MPIRLTNERWAHVTEEHGELTDMRSAALETIAQPTRILAGSYGELLVVWELEPSKFLVVVYYELEGDGFVITAFLTRRSQSLNRGKQLWP